ncbi:tRNA (cytosine(34)-C(5))-methyltransferase [Binucleata daphniae]
MFNSVNFANFCSFYKQNLNLTEIEFVKFIETLQKPLPLTFRTVNLDFTLPFTKIDYIKDAYQCVEHRNDSNYKNYRNLIIGLSNIGGIYRQEVVSMLPVLFLDLKKNHFVLDMCAAPGSKSTQIMEIVTDGLVVLNDSNRKRIDVLKTRTNKLNNKGLIITNNDARVYPNIYKIKEYKNKEKHVLGDKSTRDATNSNAESKQIVYNDSINNESNKQITTDVNIEETIKYDRILCDVPCSGDATLRKNPDISNKWQISDGVTLAKTQFTILKRGLSLLKENGILVYSTCSFNPIENEAVVQRAVLECDCEIIEKSIDGLIARKGLKTWELPIKKGERNSWMFPQHNNDVGLEKCIRIMPHDQNTGGFFIAVLRKKQKLSDTKESILQNIEDTIDNSTIGYKTIDENSINNTCLNDPNLDKCNITNETELFSSTKVENKFYLVNENTKTNIEIQYNISIDGYLSAQSHINSVVSVISKDIYNIGMANNKALKVISIGYKGFSKNGFKGLETENFRVKPGVLNEYDCTNLSENDTILLLENEFVEYEHLSIEKQKIGSFVVSLYDLNCKISVWSGRDKISLLLDKNYKKAYLEILKYKSGINNQK